MGVTNLNQEQFHEMTKDEFEALPGTFFHGNPSGNFNWHQPSSAGGFHVGSHRAAEEAVAARAAHGKYSDGSEIALPLKGSTTLHPTGEVLPNGKEMMEVRHEGNPAWLRGGRITSPMVNHPYHLGRYGRGSIGDMYDSGDVSANAKVREIHSKGQTMRHGIYYKNAAEDPGSISAVLPGRQFWKTHEDYLVDAREQGKVIPKRATEGYKQIPGQQVLF